MESAAYPRWRIVSLALGLTVLAALWLGPLPDAAAGRFSAHMLLHMGVVAVAAPLVAIGVAGGLLDPSTRWPVAGNPIAASIAELVVVWGWHAPVLHAAARSGGIAMGVEQGSFLVAGLWLWLSLGLGNRSFDRQRVWTGMSALFFTSMHMTLLGALFALAPRALYMHGGSTNAADQHLGGSLMLLIGGASYMAGGLFLAWKGLRDSGGDRRVAG